MKFAIVLAWIIIVGIQVSMVLSGHTLYVIPVAFSAFVLSWVSRDAMDGG